MESDDVEEQLRTTLHCDDKEKLRRKLALLQKEYLRTAQRLQRAERFDSVRKHVRSRITQQNHQDQKDREATSNPCLSSPSLTVNGTNAKQQEAPGSQRHTEGLADSDSLRRGQVIRFLLPSDAASPQTPNTGHDAARSHRPSPALRLRSRSSRLRWERQGSDACRTSDTSEDGQEQGASGEREEEEEEEKSRCEEVEVVNESEELFSSPGSESPSLLLTHWKSQESHTETGDVTGERVQGGKGGKGREDEADMKEESLLLKSQNSEEKGRDRTRNEKRVEFEENTSKDLNPTATENEKRQDHPTETKEEEKSVLNGDVKSEGLLDSCTLVEGLLFPAEYYVRTTRRMSSSQSQPDVRAVILSQLNAGRHRRGRGRGSNRGTGDSSPLATALGDAPGVDASPSSPAVSASHPGAVRGRRKRGRGRGASRRSDIITRSGPSEDPQPAIASLCPLGSEAPEPHLTPQDGQHVSTRVPGTLPTPRVNGSQCGPASGLQQSVYPMFLKSSGGKNAPVQEGGSSSDWRSLLLPSTPPTRPSPLPLLPSPSPTPLVGRLPPFDVQLDFHLPDDLFASLKLHKLRQVALESGLELFTPPSRNTRSRLALPCHRTGDPATPAPLPLSLTPTIAGGDGQTASELREQDEALKREDAGAAQEAQTPQSVSAAPERPARRGDGTKKQDTGSQQRNKQNPKHPESHEDSCRSENDGAVVAPPHLDGPLEETPPITHVTSPPTPTVESPQTTTTTTTTTTTPPPRERSEESGHRPKLHSQLLLSPPLTSTTPQRPPSALPLSSPMLPSLGLTPQSVSTGLPLTSSPAAASAAPALTPPPPPPPHSPATRDLSPPTLSRCPSISSLPPSSQDQAPPECRPGVEPTSCAPEETREQPVTRSTYTLKAPAGGRLVDACCLPGPSGGVCVAAAGKWAVCVWSQTPASDWSLTHTWTFNDPVISVSPVPDAAGLMFVTLGQLEIREVRLLSCSSLTQLLLCDGLVQAVVGVSKSRVVTSSLSATGSTLQVFQVSDGHSTPAAQPLVSPGVCVGALAPVDGLSDALIATDEGGHVFVWNLRSGQLLCRIVLGDGLSHTSCLRGYSHHGVLFVLLQHHVLSSPEGRGKDNEAEKEVLPEDDRKRDTFFSLVAVNPLSGKSVVATRLYPPKAWSGRLCEADVSGGGGGVVGLSQSGCVCVWELGRGGATRMVWAPESEGWQLARWGAAPDTLLTGHHGGDVTLHRYS